MIRLRCILISGLLIVCACQQSLIVDKEQLITTYQAISKELTKITFQYDDLVIEFGDEALDKSFSLRDEVFRKYYHPDVISRMNKHPEHRASFAECEAMTPHVCVPDLESFEVVSQKDKKVCLKVYDYSSIIFEIFMHYEYLDGEYKYAYATRSVGFTEDSLNFEILDPRKAPKDQVKPFAKRGCAFDLW